MRHLRSGLGWLTIILVSLFLVLPHRGEAQTPTDTGNQGTGTTNYLSNTNPYYAWDQSNGYIYPNTWLVGQCTWYVWGRCADTGWVLNSAPGANTEYSAITNGSGKGLTPQVGAIECCYYGPSSSPVYHVCYVYHVDSATSWEIAQFNVPLYAGYSTETTTRSSSSSTSLSNSKYGSTTLVGFIYPPTGSGGGQPGNPNGTITTPSQNQNVGNTITFSGTDGDSTGNTVVNVKLSLDSDNNVIANINSPGSTWSTSFNPAAYSLGSHTVKLTVTDQTGTSASVTQTFNIVDTTPPTVSISSPANGYVIPWKKPITIAGTASDDRTLSYTTFYVNGSWQGTSGGTSFSYSWDPSSYADGSYNLTIVATDTSGNTSSATITVVVSVFPMATPKVITGQDGYIELFCRAADGTPWHVRQDSTNGGFSTWQSFGGTVSGNVIPGMNQNGTIEFFARGTDGIIYSRSQASVGGSWGGWGQLGTICVTSDPAIGMNASVGALQVFASDSAGELLALGQVAPNGAWGTWASLGGTLNYLATPSVGTDVNGCLEVFGLFADGSTQHLWQQTPNGAWAGWGSFGGTVSGTPTVGALPDGRLMTFSRGTDNVLYTVWETALNGSWSNWYGGFQYHTFASNSVVANDRNGSLTVVARGTDNAIYYCKLVSGSWTNWVSLGGGVTSDPALAVNQDGRLQIFVRGTDGVIYTIWELTSGVNNWSSWAAVGDGVGRF